MIATPGHARHHMSVLHESSGTLIIGDAAGTQLKGGNLYPNVPPSDCRHRRRAPRASPGWASGSRR